MKKLIRLSLFVIVLLGLLDAGCGGGRSRIRGVSGKISCFVFESEREGLAGDVICDNIFVKTFKIDRPFESCRFIYKKADNSYETDYYNRFVSSPEVLITQQCRDWLERSGAFKNVLNVSSMADADYVLEGNVISLYGDFTQGDSAFAVMQIRFFVIKKTKGEAVIMFGKDYAGKEEINATGPESLVAGYNKCLVKILGDFEKDMRSLSF